MLKRLELPGEDAGVTVEELLARVRIMRAFDFLGVCEAIDEIKSALSTRPEKETWPQPVRQIVHKSRRREREVLDSEDEEDDEAHDLAQLELGSSSRVDAETSSPSLEGGLVVVDNLSSVVSSLMKSNHVQGQ